VGRSFANLHIKSKDLEKTIGALKKLGEEHPEVLGLSTNRADSEGRGRFVDELPKQDHSEINVVMYISKSNESWISVLHDYFVWGTVKKVGKALSRLIEEPVMTAGYMNEEIFELSVFEKGDLQAERIFCEPWTREEYGLPEGRLQDDYLRESLDIHAEAMADFIKITSPEQAVNQLSALVSLPMWSDSEWLPYQDELRTRFEKYEFHIQR